jgi:hypothetical protein
MVSASGSSPRSGFLLPCSSNLGGRSIVSSDSTDAGEGGRSRSVFMLRERRLRRLRPPPSFPCSSLSPSLFLLLCRTGEVGADEAVGAKSNCTLLDGCCIEASAWPRGASCCCSCCSCFVGELTPYCHRDAGVSSHSDTARPAEAAGNCTVDRGDTVVAPVGTDDREERVSLRTSVGDPQGCK